MCFSQDRYCTCKYATEINGPNGTCVCINYILTEMRPDGHCYCPIGNSHSRMGCFWTYFGVALGSLVGLCVVWAFIEWLIEYFLFKFIFVEPDTTTCDVPEVLTTEEPPVDKDSELPGYESLPPPCYTLHAKDKQTKTTVNEPVINGTLF